MPANAMPDLIRSLVDNVEFVGDQQRTWDALAIILEFPDGRFNEAHGYFYPADGSVTAVASDPWKVRAAVDAYTESIYAPGAPLPRKILIQFDRISGKYAATFEEADEDRWKVTPRNFRELPEELRPA